MKHRLKNEQMFLLRKYLTYVSNGLLIAGGAIALYVLAKIYILDGNRQPGVCPLTTNRPWIYLAIALLVASFCLSLFEPKKRENKNIPQVIISR
jgi:hypothetical protein